MQSASITSPPCVVFVPYPPHDRVAVVALTGTAEATRSAGRHGRWRAAYEQAERGVHRFADWFVGWFVAGFVGGFVGRFGGKLGGWFSRLAGTGAFGRLAAKVRRRFAAGTDLGMSTAEYAVGTVAACGFAALLYKVLTGGAVTSALTDLVNRALHAV